MKIRNILIAVISVVMLMVASVNAKENTEPVKVVYPLDFPDVKRVHFMLNTLNNLVKYYQKNFIDYEVSIVVYGPGLQYAMHNFKDTGFVGKPYLRHGGPTGNGTQGRIHALKQLAGDNLRFFVCENTMKKKNVKKEQLHPFAEVTEGGVLKLIELQNEGAALIKIK
ncbi:MAG: hypothetical protein COB17_01365 [Sulfurimonas sp.]|nr:MAG: hypothetical protein COB17_01365 [Sulfurimonas sp.]